MDIDVSERNISHELQTHHHHPGYPEEEDIETGHQDRGGIEVLQSTSFLLAIPKWRKARGQN